MGLRRIFKELMAGPPKRPAEPSGQRPSEQGKLAGKVVILRGSGDFDLQVVGESHRQEELKRVAGPYTNDGRRVQELAVMMPDESNPHDSNAVMVRIGAVRVGYLDRENARLWREEVFATGVSGAGCQAIITGGWDRGRGDIGMYGVRLDVCYPFVVIAMDDA